VEAVLLGEVGLPALRALTTFYLQGDFWSTSELLVRLEALGQFKNPTPLVIELTTFHNMQYSTKHYYKALLQKIY
jgi:hypothetical protein